MKIAANLTELEGRILSFKKADNAPGGEVQFEVVRNLTAPPNEDFIGAQEGDVLQIYLRSAKRFEPDKLYTAEVILNADERGEKVVARSIELSSVPALRH